MPVDEDATFADCAYATLRVLHESPDPNSTETRRALDRIAEAASDPAKMQALLNGESEADEDLTDGPRAERGGVAYARSGTPLKYGATKDTARSLARVGKELAHRKEPPLPMPGYGQIYTQEGKVWYVGGDGDDDGFEKLVKQKIKEAYPGATEIICEAEAFPPKDEDWIKVYPAEEDARQYEKKAGSTMPEPKRLDHPDVRALLEKLFTTLDIPKDEIAPAIEEAKTMLEEESKGGDLQGQKGVQENSNGNVSIADHPAKARFLALAARADKDGDKHSARLYRTQAENYKIPKVEYAKGACKGDCGCAKCRAKNYSTSAGA